MRALLAAPVLALLAVIGCGRPAASAPAPAPNVVLVVIDTLRTDHVSAYGYALPTTPRLDALAARGTLFERCSAQSSWTLTSMISLMTGRPVFTPVYRVPDAVPLLAEAFAGAGYRTGAVVANSVLAAEAGFARGIGAWDARERMGARWGADEVNARAFAFLDEPDPRPFFLWLHYLDPHAPNERAPLWKRAPEEVFAPFERVGIRRAIEAAPDDERPYLAYEVAALADDVDRYDTELRFLDERLGALLDRLDAPGLRESTYVVVVADHGETLYRRPEQADRIATLRAFRAEQDERMRLSDYVKLEHAGLPYEELLHVPWIVAGPGVPAGRRVEALASNLDLMPTLLGLAGVPPPRGLAGRDLSGALRTGAPIGPADWVVASFEDIASARAADGSKVVLVGPRSAALLGVPAERAYALDADPFELLPGALDEGARALAQRLRAAIAADPFATFGDALDEETRARLEEMGYLR